MSRKQCIEFLTPGNPEGDKRSAGIDPGLLLTRKIFALMGSEPGTSSTSDNDKGLDLRDLAEMVNTAHASGSRVVTSCKHIKHYLQPRCFAEVCYSFIYSPILICHPIWYLL